MPKFEKEVKKALIDHDLTMGMLADRLGISIAYVSDLIKGKRTNKTQISRICRELHIDAGEMLGDTEKGAAV